MTRFWSRDCLGIWVWKEFAACLANCKVPKELTRYVPQLTIRAVSGLREGTHGETAVGGGFWGIDAGKNDHCDGALRGDGGCASRGHATQFAGSVSGAGAGRRV